MTFQPVMSAKAIGGVQRTCFRSPPIVTSAGVTSSLVPSVTCVASVWRSVTWRLQTSSCDARHWQTCLPYTGTTGCVGTCPCLVCVLYVKGPAEICPNWQTTSVAGAGELSMNSAVIRLWSPVTLVSTNSSSCHLAASNSSKLVSKGGAIWWWSPSRSLLFPTGNHSLWLPTGKVATVMERWFCRPSVAS